MKTAILLLALSAVCAAISIRARYKTPWCHVVESQCFSDVIGSCDLAVSQYWVSPFITNGNRVTHVCAHLYTDTDHTDRWAVEIPTMKGVDVRYPLTHGQALSLIADHCRRWF